MGAAVPVQIRAQALLLLRERQRQAEAQQQASPVRLAAFVEQTTNHTLDAWQHDLCTRLESLAHTTGRRLLIHAPPQMGKSIIVSQRFPAWLLSQKPEHRVKLACYNVTHATRFGRIVRDLMQSKEFADLFPKPDLRLPTICSAEEWSTEGRLKKRDSQPSFKALGLATGFVGQGADCFPAGTLIKTEKGMLDIQHLSRLKYLPNVYAYDHRAGQIVLRRIEATREIFTDELIEIETTAGRKFKCTPNHRIHVEGRGYLAAEALTEGAPLSVCGADLHEMQQSVLASQFRSSEVAFKGVQGHLLFSGMLARSPRNQERRSLQDLWKAKASHLLVLLSKLQGIVKQVLEIAQARAANILRVLLRTVSGDFTPDAVLFTQLRQCSALNEDARRGQFALQGWRELREMVCGNAPVYSSARWAEMCHLPNFREAFSSALERADSYANKPANSSHQPRTKRQHGRELDCALQEVPQEASRLSSDTVAVVRRIRSGRIPVYDIQVEDCCNFFAEGVLVHNCLIVDDPYSSPEDARSETINAKVHSFWTDTARPRLNDNTNVVVMFHRYTENDLAGFLMETEPDEWELIRYAGQADGDYEHPVTKKNYPDVLAREEGQYLSPRFSDGWYEKQQANGFTWLSQFQGRPSAKEGAFFTISKFDAPLSAAPAGLRMVRGWDLASTAGQGDYTAGVKLGVDPNGTYYVLDVARGQWSSDQRNAQLRQTTAIDGRQTKIRLAQDPGQAGKEQAEQLTRMLAGYSVKAERVSGDKITRADGFAAQVNAGNVRLIAGAWNAAFIEELRQFPNGKHDDQVDAVSDAFSELAQNRKFTSGTYQG